MSRPRIPVDRWFLFDRSIPDFRSGCWKWTGRTSRTNPKNPQGVVRAAGPGERREMASRAAYRVFRGEIPAGMLVCHRCDNSLCINPAHLFLGTHLDNMADMRSKGRQNRGERNGMAKLTVADVIDIRRRGAAGESQESLAMSFNVSRSNISRVLSGACWSHVER